MNSIAVHRFIFPFKASLCMQVLPLLHFIKTPITVLFLRVPPCQLLGQQYRTFCQWLSKTFAVSSVILVFTAVFTGNYYSFYCLSVPSRICLSQLLLPVKALTLLFYYLLLCCFFFHLTYLHPHSLAQQILQFTNDMLHCHLHWQLLTPSQTLCTLIHFEKAPVEL